ncbi:ankyrin repeat-containing protein NPR4-like [Corylus avellana]|uniref:ankyrin repeat-containing protein NPR4-like n=1 Tax=Corylus avellana TaxID=13451 RepID=UPI00286CC7B5|nr:ankyrin repeat-containing protein NPR4-like [Corylus avellana]
MKEGATNMRRRQVMDHQQRFSSFLSFPRTAYSPDNSSLRHTTSYSDHNEIHQGSVSSVPTPFDQGAVAGGTDLSQGSSLNARTSQREFVRLSVEEPGPGKANGVAGRAGFSPLLQAALKGDWQAAKALIAEDPNCVRARITEEGTTALHTAAIAKHTDFVEQLLKSMRPDDLKLKSIEGATALHSAAQTGIVRIAEEMVKMNDELPSIADNQETTPLHVAAFLGRHRNMVDYLFSVTSLARLTTPQLIELLLATISAGFFDKALAIHAQLQTVDPECVRKALQELARKPIAIGSKRQPSLWERCLKYSVFKRRYRIALMKTLARQLVEVLWKEVNGALVVQDQMDLIFEATKSGNVEFLIIILRSYPELIWKIDKNYGSLFHVAVLYRQEGVFNLIYEIGAIKDNIATYIDKDNNNMLHLAGKLAPSDELSIISSPSIQMQWELLWFMEVKKIVPPSYVNKKNSRGQTPREVFRMTHKDLQENGEKWIKKTVSYCMLVATLIATVAFAAAFTVPGGNDQDTGSPILLIRNWFMIFFISDVTALFFSSTSILIFLSILTSPYTEEDFLKSIPLRLLLGLATLFTSIGGMVLSFSATCILINHNKMIWVPKVIIVLAAVPIHIFIMHVQLWVSILYSSFYLSVFLFRPCKRRLF